MAYVAGRRSASRPVRTCTASHRCDNMPGTTRSKQPRLGRAWRGPAITVAAAAAAAWTVSALILPRQWEASALILFVPGQAGIGRLSSIQHHTVGSVDRRADVAMSILQSRRLRLAIIKETGYRDRYGGGDVEETCRLLGRAMSVRVGGSGQVRLEVRLGGTPVLGPGHRRDDAVGQLAEDVVVEALRELGAVIESIRDSERASLAEALADELGRLHADPGTADAARQRVAEDLALVEALANWDDPPFHVLDEPHGLPRPVAPRPWSAATLTGVAMLALWLCVLVARWLRAAPSVLDAGD